MAGIQFTVSLDALAPLAGLSELGHSLTDLTNVMDSIGRELVNSASERIGTTNIGPDGQAWVPSHRVRETGGKTLLKSGLLQRSINSQAAPDHVIVGSNMVYAAVMHFGAEQGEFGAAMGRTEPSTKRPQSQSYFTPLPWGDIPARPYIGISEEDEMSIRDVVAVHISSIVGALQ